jgi:DNA-directed RNA polymerase specialized sigma24 family protein
LFIATQKPIAAVLLRRFCNAGLTWEEAGDLATDAIVSYLSEPQRFDPNRASLFTYLVTIANGDALNLCRDRRREQKNHTRLVELSAAEGNVLDGGADDRLDAERLIRAHIDKVAETDVDRQVLELMLQGERDTTTYAAVLGVAHLPIAEQRGAIKKCRDKIEKRLKRLGAELC